MPTLESQSESVPSEDLKLLDTADWRPGLDIRLNLGQADFLSLISATVIEC